MFLAIYILLSATISQADLGQAFFYMEDTYCSNPTRVNNDMGNRLEVGDLIQVIYSNGEIDPPDPTDPYYIGGDDELLDTWAVGDDDAGWEVIGEGEFGIKVFGIVGGVYIRAWDAGTISAAHYYGETGVYALAPQPNPPAEYFPATFSTNNPKPGGEPPATPTVAPTPTDVPEEVPEPTETPALVVTPVEEPAPTPTPTPSSYEEWIALFPCVETATAQEDDPDNDGQSNIEEYLYWVTTGEATDPCDPDSGGPAPE